MCLVRPSRGRYFAHSSGLPAGAGLERRDQAVSCRDRSRYRTHPETGPACRRGQDVGTLAVKRACLVTAALRLGDGLPGDLLGRGSAVAGTFRLQLLVIVLHAIGQSLKIYGVIFGIDQSPVSRTPQGVPAVAEAKSPMLVDDVPHILRVQIINDNLCLGPDGGTAGVDHSVAGPAECENMRLVGWVAYE